MSEPKWTLMEWEAVYGCTYGVTNDNDTLEYLWGGMPAGKIRLYLANVEDYIDREDRQPYQTSNDFGDLRYGGPR